MTWQVAATLPLASGLDANEPVVVWTATPTTLMPYTIDLSDYSPMQTSDAEVHLSCAPGGPHCAELNQLQCSVCHSYCKEPGGPTNCCFCRQEQEAKQWEKLKYVPSRDETIHHLGAVYPYPGGSTPRPHISRSSGRTKAHTKLAREAVTKKKQTAKSLPQLWGVQLQRLQMLIRDRQRLMRSKVCAMVVPNPPSHRDLS